MRIVAATAGDLEAVRRIERAVPEAPHWTEAEYKAIVGSPIGSVRRRLLVCMEDEELLGFAVARIVVDEAELESVVVRASARRTGVGRALCAAVIAWAWEQGAWAMDLEVRASSAGARTLYEALGFVESGRRRGYYADPREDALRMRLRRSAAHPDG